MASSHSSSHSSSSSSRRSNLNIHKIREFELEKVYQVFQLKFSTKIMIILYIPLKLLTQVHLMDEFDILQIVGEGWFGKILLVEHKATDTEMVLKGILFALNILIALTVQVFHFIIQHFYLNF